MGFIQKIVFHILATSAIFWAVKTYVFPETFLVTGGAAAYPILAIVFGTLNLFIKPFLKILTFPIHFVTLGLSSVILNAGLLWVWEYAINFIGISGIGLEIKDISTYFFIAIIFAIANAFLHWFER